MNKNASYLCEQYLPEVIQLRHNFHKFPEIGYNVKRTSGIVSDYLKKLGIEVQTGIAKTGVIGDIKVRNATKTLALRADMDALPIQELGDKPYKSTISGKAHLCGHDAHTAMLLGAAKVIASMKNELKCNVRFIFQPSEEQSPSGAKAMIEENAIKGVDQIHAIHVMPNIEEGEIALYEGTASANTDFFNIDIKGKGSHASAPHTAIDPILIGSQLIQSVYSQIPRAISPNIPHVLTFTEFKSGNSSNTIPNSAFMRGTVRTFDEESQETIRNILKSQLETVCLVSGASYDLDYQRFCPSVYNHPDAFKLASEVAIKIVGDNQFKQLTKPEFGGEDFAHYTKVIPGCITLLGTKNEKKGMTSSCHSPYFDLNDPVMKIGMAFHTQIALNFN